MGLMHSRGESEEGRQIRIEDARPNSSWPAIRAWPQFVRSVLAHNREQMMDITLEAEGCNATCHSKAWGRLAEDKLKGFNLSFPWMDAITKSFAGLGATTKTLGKRKLPFCLSLDYGYDTLAGCRGHGEP